MRHVGPRIGADAKKTCTSSWTACTITPLQRKNAIRGARPTRSERIYGNSTNRCAAAERCSPLRVRRPERPGRMYLWSERMPSRRPRVTEYSRDHAPRFSGARRTYGYATGAGVAAIRLARIGWRVARRRSRFVPCDEPSECRHIDLDNNQRRRVFLDSPAAHAHPIGGIPLPQP